MDKIINVTKDKYLKETKITVNDNIYDFDVVNLDINQYITTKIDQVI